MSTELDQNTKLRVQLHFRLKIMCFYALMIVYISIHIYRNNDNEERTSSNDRMHSNYDMHGKPLRVTIIHRNDTRYSLLYC